MIPNRDIVLDVSKAQKNDDGNSNGDEERIGNLVHDEVRNHGDQPANKVTQSHGDAGDPRAVNVWLLKTQRKIHPETNPLLAALAQLLNKRRGGLAGDAVLFQDAEDVVALLLGQGAPRLRELALLLGVVVVALGDGGEVGAQAHADHAGEELGHAAHDDELCAAEGGEAGCEGEGDGEAV